MNSNVISFPICKPKHRRNFSVHEFDMTKISNAPTTKDFECKINLIKSLRFQQKQDIQAKKTKIKHSLAKLFSNNDSENDTSTDFSYKMFPDY